MAKQKTKALATRTWDDLVEQASAEERRLRRLLEVPWYRVALGWGTKNVCVEVNCFGNNYSRSRNNYIHSRTNNFSWFVHLPLFSFVRALVGGSAGFLIGVLLNRPISGTLVGLISCWIVLTLLRWRREISDDRQQHFNEIQHKIAQLPRKEAGVVELLQHEMTKAREDVIGHKAPVTVLRESLSKRISETRATLEQLAYRMENSGGENRDALQSAHERLTALLPRLEGGMGQLDGYIAKVEAFFREAAEGVNDLPLLRRARELEAGGEKDLDKVDDVVETSLRRLGERLAEIQTEVQSALAGSEELFLSGSVSLEDDLKRYEDIAEQLANAAFPKFPAKGGT